MTQKKNVPLFEEMSFDELRRLKKKLSAEKTQETQKQLAELNSYAVSKIHAYLNNAFDITETDSPFFLAFIETFGKDNAGKLNDFAREAAAKLKPELEAFDEQNGYTGLKGVPESTMLKNMDALEKFEQINPFVSENGRLKYPEFQKAAKVLKAVKITGNDGRNLDEKEQREFRTTMLETARLETYLRLFGEKDGLTENNYLQNLREILEINLVNLLITDKIIKEYPLSEKNKKKLYESFERLSALFS